MRLTAAERFRLISGALALAEERDGITLIKAAAVLQTDVTVLTTAMNSILYLDIESGSDLYQLSQSLHLDERGQLTVDDNWLGGLARLSESDAFRLFVTAATFAAVEGTASSHLESARRKLAEVIQGIDVQERRRPSEVAALERCHQKMITARITYRGAARTLPVEESMELEPHRVYRDQEGWKLLARPLHTRRTTKHTVARVRRRRDEGFKRTAVPDGVHEFEHVGDGELLVYDVDRILSVRKGSQAFRPIDDLEIDHSAILGDDPITVTLELDDEMIDLLDDYFVDNYRSAGAGRRRLSVTVPGITDLKTLLLRVGPRGRLCRAKYRTLQRDIALEVLQLYEETANAKDSSES